MQFGSVVFSNVVISLVLAFIAAFVGKLNVAPQIRRTLWVLVLLKLVTPPLFEVQLPFSINASSVESRNVPTGALAIDSMADLDQAETSAIQEPLTAKDGSALADVSPTAQPASPRWNVNPFSFALACWFVGSVVFLTIAVARLRKLRAVLAHARPATPEVDTLIQRFGAQLGLKALPRAVAVNASVPPMVWRWGAQSTLVIPTRLFDSLDESQQQGLIAHELAHLRRGDHWMRWFELVMSVLYWWNPIVWWARSEIQQAEEECCDAWVLWALPQIGADYAQSLLDTVDFLQGTALRVVPVATAFVSGRSLRRRIQRVLDKSVSRTLSRGPQIALALICLAIAPVSLIGNEPADEQPKAESVENVEPTEGTIVISGSVVDEKDKPIADAQVCRSYGFSKLTGKSKLAETRSDEQGRFRLELPEAEILTTSSVWAFAPGYTLAGGAYKKDSETTITLTPSEELTFEIVDPEGRAISNAVVEPMNYHTPLSYDMVPHKLVRQIGQRTDESGLVRFDSLAQNRTLNVKVTTKEYGVQTQQFQLKAGQPRRRTIRIRECVSVTGRITPGELKGVKPEWLSGVRVFMQTMPPLRGDNASYPPFPTRAYAEAVTNERGEFSMPLVADGNVEILHVSIDESLPVRPQLPGFTQLNAPTDLELPLVELVEIEGSVVTSNGNPLKDKDIKLHVYYGNNWQGTDVYTDADGEFVAWVMPGNVRFQPQNLYKTNYLQFGSPKPIEVPEGDGVFEVPPIELVKAKPASGKLISQETGKPIAGVEVITYYDNWLCSSAKTNESGEFELKKIPESVEADELTYRIELALDDLRHMRNGDVKIESSSPVVVSVKETADDR